MDKLKRLFSLPLIAILALTLLLRVPSFIEPYWYGDEGVTLTVGQGIRAGMDLYKDIHDNKPPLLYWVAAAFPTLMQLKVVTAGAVLVAVFLFYHLTLNLMGRKGAIVGTLIFSILSSIPLMEGNIVNGEIWQIIFVVAAFFVFFSSYSTRQPDNHTTSKQLPIFHFPHSIFYAGFLLGIGFLFKQPVIFDAMAVGLFVIVSSTSFKSFKLFISPMVLALGFVLPFVLVSIYFLSQGTFNHFLSDAFLQNSRYANAYNDFIIPQGKLYVRLLGGVGIIGLGFVLFRKTPTLLFIASLFAFELMGAFMTGRPYMHYLLGTIPALSLGAGVLIEKRFWSKKLLLFSLVALLVLYYTITFFYNNQQMRRRTWFYYRNSIRYMAGEMNKRDFYDFFDSTTPYRYELVNVLRSFISDDQILVWSDDTLIYPMLDKQPQIGYVAAYHVSFYNKFDELQHVLETMPPRFIVTEKQDRHPFPFLQEYLKKSAKEVFSNKYYVVYETSLAGE